jgi:uncharacterized protein YbjT (DUF2867 family)
MRILVTGASGFAGSLLVPRLCADGHGVRALGRDPERVRVALACALQGARDGAGAQQRAAGGRPRHTTRHRPPGELEVVRADVLTGEGLAHALDGIEVAYYLIHSMESAPAEARQFAERERVAAERFATTAAAAGVRRIVYLGGLHPARSRRPTPHGPPAAPSRHLASREHVERILLDAVADSIALRASIVIGARSRSFRLLVRLVERMPVLTLPAWHVFRTQPIDARDVTELLAACATATTRSRSLDVGGPDVLTYGEMLAGIAELMLVNRPSVRVGVNLTGIAARVAAAVAGEDPALVVALMQGLQGDLIAADDHAAEQLGVRLHSFQAAVQRALAEWEQFETLAAR